MFVTSDRLRALMLARRTIVSLDQWGVFTWLRLVPASHIRYRCIAVPPLGAPDCACVRCDPSSRARAAVASSSNSLHTRWCRHALYAARLRRAHTSAILYTGDLAIAVTP
jgi:hypothetical protein